MTTLGKTPPLITQINVLVLHMTKLKIASMLVNHSTGLHFHTLTSMLFKNTSHYNINQVTKKKGNLLTENYDRANRLNLPFLA